MILFQNKQTLNTLLILCGLFISSLIYAQTETITICAGESTTLTNLTAPPYGMPGPVGQFGCTTPYRTIEPNDASAVRSGDTFTVSPHTTTTYTVTSASLPSSPGGCNPGSEITQVFEILVEGNCIKPTDKVFEDYPWLTTIVNPSLCTNETITVYNYGSYNFIYIQNDYDSKLYYQNGTFYCSDSPGYSCLALYNLNEVESIWSCNQSTGDSICELPADPGPCDVNRRRFYYDDAVGDCLTFQYGGCEGNANNFTSYFVCMENACVEEVQCPDGDPLEWDWIQNIISNANGCPNRVEVFEGDGTTYVLLAQNGPLCGDDFPNEYYSCKGNYICFRGGNAPPGADDGCTFGEISNSRILYEYDKPVLEGCTNLYACNYNPAANLYDGSCSFEDCNLSETIFEDYPWVNTYVNQNNCTNETITAYTSGLNNFIFIQDETGNHLFDQDGDYYCSDVVSYTCLDIYGLTTTAGSWICENVRYDDLGCTDPLACNFDPLAGIDDESCIYDGCNNQSKIFDDYPWLNTYVNQNNCTSETIAVYNYRSNSNFIFIQDETGSHLFYQDGTYYCSDVPGYSCLSVYGLDAIADSWSCEDIIIGQCSNSDPLNYPWIQGIINNETFLPCTPQEIEMFYNNGNPYFILNNSNLCDFTLPGGGSTILDCEGNTYCTTIGNVTCNNEILEAAQNSEVIWRYEKTNCGVENPISDLPWLGTYINNSISTPIKISMYYYNYEVVFLINTSNDTNEGEVYDCEGRLYCSLQDCVEFYEEAVFMEVIYNTFYAEPTFDFTKYPWLNTIVNPVDCNEQPQVTEYSFRGYAFIYVKTINGGSLYLDNGTFYCSDEDGQTCLNYYNLTEATTAWACNNRDDFQKFDYVYTICEGESVELFGLSETVYIPCYCPPCSPVGGSEEPTTIWYPPNGVCSDFCYSFTVSPTNTTNYMSTSEKITSGASSICNPAPPTLIENVIKHYLVIVEPCSPAKTISVEQTLEKIATPNFKLYPNPTSDKVFIDLENMQDAPTEITLLDMQGKVLQIVEAGNLESKVEMDVSNYLEGIYLIELKNTKTTIIEKLIVK